MPHPNPNENKNMNYAYADGSIGWQHPSSRRRFPRYCYLAGIKLNQVDWGNLPDVLVVNQAADLSYCSKLKKSNKKIIFDANDGYLIPKKKDIYDSFRGTSKFILGQHRHLEFNYEKTYLNMCERADAVVCSHPLQQKFLQNYCKNIHLITDFGPEINLDKKVDYKIGAEINIFWEGLGSSRYMPFQEINHIFKNMSDRKKYKFHIFTDLDFCKISNKLFRTTVMTECRKKAPDIADQFYFYQWNEKMLSTVATKCDVAIIPISLDNKFSMYKPENKLILMWRMAIPTIVSATPSYSIAMQMAGLDYSCINKDDWKEKLNQLLGGGEDFRRKCGLVGHQYAINHFDDRTLAARWSKVLESLFL